MLSRLGPLPSGSVVVFMWSRATIPLSGRRWGLPSWPPPSFRLRSCSQVPHQAGSNFGETRSA